MTEAEFERLLNQLESNVKCILVLGPEFINIDSAERDYTESIHDFLVKKKILAATAENYFSEDGFLLYETINQKHDALYQLEKFYKNLEVTESYNKLARIPFTSIISLSPDDLIVQAFKKINRDHVFCKYRNNGFEPAPQETSRLTPMIYNLFGHYNYPTNLIFTFDNLFAFLDKLFQNTEKNLQLHITEATNFLFLGFNYDKWYLKFIFYLLKKIGGESQRHAIFDYNPKNDQFDSKTKYYKVSYSLKFYPENEKEFIDSLYNACRNRGLLVDVKTIQSSKVPIQNISPENKYKVLFFAASPNGKMTLKSGDKYLEIKKNLNKDFYELLDKDGSPNLKLTRGGINPGVNDNSPHMIYFNCHGTPDGQLILTSINNEPDYLPLDELRDMIKDLAVEHTQINCIVFAACKSEKQAKEISTIVPYCIGMSETILEEVSSYFTIGFFQGFVRDNQNFKYCFNMGVSAIKNCEIKGYRQYANIPVLYINGKKYEKQPELNNQEAL